MATNKEYRHIRHADVELFNMMRVNYLSENEKQFFEELEYKEENEASFAYDWLMEHNENEDGIEIYRQSYSEYSIDKKYNDKWHGEVHFDTLAELLAINLKEYGYLDRDITFWQWLREHDYSCIRYDRDGDWD